VSYFIHVTKLILQSLSVLLHELSDSLDILLDQVSLHVSCYHFFLNDCLHHLFQESHASHSEFSVTDVVHLNFYQCHSWVFWLFNVHLIINIFKSSWNALAVYLLDTRVFIVDDHHIFTHINSVLQAVILKCNQSFLAVLNVLKLLRMFIDK